MVLGKPTHSINLIVFIGTFKISVVLSQGEISCFKRNASSNQAKYGSYIALSLILNY